MIPKVGTPHNFRVCHAHSEFLHRESRVFQKVGTHNRRNTKGQHTRFTHAARIVTVPDGIIRTARMASVCRKKNLPIMPLFHPKRPLSYGVNRATTLSRQQSALRNNKGVAQPFVLSRKKLADRWQKKKKENAKKTHAR